MKTILSSLLCSTCLTLTGCMQAPQPVAQTQKQHYCAQQPQLCLAPPAASIAQIFR